MKRLVMVVLGVMVVAGNCFAMNFATSIDTTSKQTIINSPCYLHRITLTNENASVKKVSLEDSGVTKGWVVVPANGSLSLQLECRIAGKLNITCEATSMFCMAEYEGGVAYGNYWYAVSDTTTKTNLYNSWADVIGVIITNNDGGGAGKKITISDSTTDKIKISCSAGKTEKYNFERIRFLNNVQATCGDTEMSAIVIRRD